METDEEVALIDMRVAAELALDRKLLRQLEGARGRLEKAARSRCACAAWETYLSFRASIRCGDLQ